ncbi:MAG: hypothetical protein A3J63_04405 [Candidatus Moranbacteria bacterium RIFCSPHIGHO2_02_FULL_40_12b]|nr:MAG: hypothetical protein A3J63_04405 [Candidatus Moranbacteria bacterium RIFCSPHIGHO2_02_FULL_40_12b]OGI23857.1 MAG: hypothetical protein A3E91_00485 [Candidatus Moranbacteria bacterium RIFCSPHIGHO2_12_FULL_40_10]
MFIFKYKKSVILMLILLAVVIGGFYYFYNQVYYSHGNYAEKKIFKIKKGEGNAGIATRLKNENLISGKIYFYYYLRKNKLTNKILPGEYEFSGKLTIPEIAHIITQKKDDSIKVTFPEGWTTKEMELRIKNNELSGTDKFSELVKSADYFKETYNYDFLDNLPEGASLEGFLFPDTYFFAKNITAEGIIKKMLDNFDRKLSDDLNGEIKRQGKSIYEIMTMASIIENEVRTEDDRKTISDIFWGRIRTGQPLQSCATLAYILGVNKKQYSFEDTRVNSPYNTYLNKGLPPGPISNSGLISIKAAIYPIKTDYNYFLSDPETGQTIFSKTIEEHNANKVKYGL